MKVMITGVTGQLGRALVESAPAHITIRALTRADLDLSDTSAITAEVVRMRPDVILNTAAYTAVDSAESDEANAIALNCNAPATLARAAKSTGARLVHISTDFVFDGRASTPYVPLALAAPLNVYGASKLAGEEAIRAILPDALIVRTAWLYSVYGHNFVKTMLRLMRERGYVQVVVDQIGTPTHVESLARALWAMIAVGACGTYHYTDAGVASWYDFAVATQEEALALGLLAQAVPIVPIMSADYRTPAPRPTYSVLDKTDCWALLGEHAAHWRVELRLMLANFRDLHRD